MPAVLSGMPCPPPVFFAAMVLALPWQLQQALRVDLLWLEK
jgi:hypothetical protein